MENQTLLMFPLSGALFFFAWIFFGVTSPSRLPLSDWKVPGIVKWFAVLGSILLGPVVPLVIYTVKLTRSAVNYRKESEERREQKRLNDIMLENSRGMFMTGTGDEAEAGAVNMVKKLILQGVDKGASDIFIDPETTGSNIVRMRVDGSLRHICTLEPSMAKGVVGAIKVIAGMDITERRRPQDGAFSAKIESELISFRVASVGAYSGEKVSIRILGSASGPRSLSDLGLSAEDFDVIDKAIKLPSGMVLMCGPTGSGKTSTLYAMLKSIDYSIKNVISIEDPIENIMPQISQMEVNNKAGITFGSLLRNALRQNPDIICLGEIRDEETAEIAVQAAQTGHLIIATVHSNDNLGTVDRLQNLGVPLRTVAATLRVIISQRLVRTLCPACKKHITLPPELQEYFQQADLPTDEVYAPCGCPQCDGTGYAGRRAVFDVMVMNHQLRDLLEDESTTLATVQSYIEREHGSSMMFYKGYQLVAQGICSIEEINRIALNLG